MTTARPEEMEARLRRHGFAREVDLGCAEYRALAFGDAARGMRGHEFHRVALARAGGARPGSS